MIELKKIQKKQYNQNRFQLEEASPLAYLSLNRYDPSVHSSDSEAGIASDSRMIHCEQIRQTGDESNSTINCSWRRLLPWKSDRYGRYTTCDFHESPNRSILRQHPRAQIVHYRWFIECWIPLPCFRRTLISENEITRLSLLRKTEIISDGGAPYVQHCGRKDNTFFLFVCLSSVIESGTEYV